MKSSYVTQLSTKVTMTNKISIDYFNWMCKIIQRNKPFNGEHYQSKVNDYRLLLKRLHETEFVYLMEMDENRAKDGINLRFRFGHERNYSASIITMHFDDRPCSVLEMMVALCLECEESVMDDPDVGDRTGVWFWGMIENLGLNIMNDQRFDIEYVDEVVNTFLNREYQSNGNGGLFTVNNARCDMRIVDIWYQMMWYLNENFVFSV